MAGDGVPLGGCFYVVHGFAIARGYRPPYVSAAAGLRYPDVALRSSSRHRTEWLSTGRRSDILGFTRWQVEQWRGETSRGATVTSIGPAKDVVLDHAFSSSSALDRVATTASLAVTHT